MEQVGYLDAAFIKGASDGLVESGADTGNPEAIYKSACFMCKIAKSRDYEDDEGFWEGNKGWIIPTLAALGAFHVGGIVGRTGRPDRSLLSNLYHSISDAWSELKPSYGKYDGATNLAKYGPTKKDKLGGGDANKS